MTFGTLGAGFGRLGYGGGRPVVDHEIALWAAQVVANGGSVTAARAALITSFVAALKTGGAWALTDDIWMLAAENAPQALTSIKQRRLAVAVNAPTFLADRHFAFDGASQHIDTGFIPTTHKLAMTGTSLRIGVYERTNVAATTYAAGARDDFSSQGLALIPRGADSALYAIANSDARVSAATVTDSRGLTAISRATSTFAAFRNGAAAPAPAAGGTTGSALSLLPLFVGAINNTGSAALHRAASIAYADVGAALSAGQELAAYNAVQAHLTALGAAV